VTDVKILNALTSDVGWIDNCIF